MLILIALITQSSKKAASGQELGKIKLLHLLEGMHECVVVADHTGVIIGFNRAAKQMFGCISDESQLHCDSF